MLTAISWRNLWRNKLRSIVIITAVIVGVMGGILTDGFDEGMMQQRVNAAIDNELSNIQLHNPEFLLNNEIQYTIQNPDNYNHFLSQLPQVKGVSDRLVCAAMASTANAATSVIITGINPEQESQVTDIHSKLIKGSYPSKDQRIPALIGKKLADKLNLNVQDKLIVTLADSSGTITYGAYLVCGIYETSNHLFDEVHMFVLKDDLGSLTGLKGQVHEIAVALHDNNTTNVIAQQLEEHFRNNIAEKTITIQTWEQLEPLLKSMIEMMEFFSYIFMIIILVALAFAIINTMTMAIMERTHEIGMLMAIGMNKKKIFFMILLETSFLSLVGGLLGLLFSYLIVNYFSTTGFNLGSMGKGLSYIGYDSVVYFHVTPIFYLASFILVALTAVLSSISPSIKALKLNPADAIRDIN